MITPQRHVRKWLHNHNKSALELSAMLGKSSSYVSTFLCPSGGNPVAIQVLDEWVHFPPEILRSAVHKLALLNKKKRRQIDYKAQQLFDTRMRAWKAPKEVV